MAKQKIDPEAWYVCVETASVTLDPDDFTAFTTVREGERRRGDDPLLEHAAQFFLPESMPPEERTRIVAERRQAENDAIKADERRRNEESRRQQADEREQAHIEAQKRVVHVSPPYPEQMDPLHPQAAQHPMIGLAAGIAQAMGPSPR